MRVVINQESTFHGGSEFSCEFIPQKSMMIDALDEDTGTSLGDFHKKDHRKKAHRLKIPKWV